MTRLKGEGLTEWAQETVGLLPPDWLEMSSIFLSRELLRLRIGSLEGHLRSAEEVMERPQEQQAWVERLIQGYHKQAEEHRRRRGDMIVSPPPLDRGGFYRLKEHERAQFLDRTAQLLELGLAKEGPLPLVVHCQDTWRERLGFYRGKLAELDSDVWAMSSSRWRIEGIKEKWSGRLDV